MNIISVNYADDAELASVYNEGVLAELSESTIKIILATGPRSYVYKLNSEIIDNANYILYYLGETYHPQYIGLVVVLLIVEHNSEDVLFVNIDRGERYTISDLFADDLFLNLFWMQIKSLKTEGQPQSLKTVANSIRMALSFAESSDVVGALSKAVSLVNNLIDIEDGYWLGNETRGLHAFIYSNNLIRINSLSEIVNYDFSYFMQAYTSLKERLIQIGYASLEAVSDRISYQDIAVQCSIQVNAELSQRTLPKIFVWLSTYCLMLALQFKKRKSYVVSVNFCVRALELYCQGLLVYANLANFDTYGRFIVNGCSTSGAGEIWKQTYSNMSGFISSGIDKNKVTNIIYLRNGDLLGHGVVQCNELMFNEAFSTIKKCISDLDRIYAPTPKLFDGLISMHRHNILKSLDMILARCVLYELALQKVGN